MSASFSICVTGLIIQAYYRLGQIKWTVLLMLLRSSVLFALINVLHVFKLC